jgi:Domain of unknown function(DUF2779).
MARPPRLSKSRYQAGLQCPKRLWLECYQRELADPIDEATQAIFDQGHRVGELARDRFAGGVLVAEDYTQSEAALRTTADLLASGADCLYEAAFTHDDVFVRPDILLRGADGRYDLIEVKSSSRVKPEHVTDAGVQTYVVEEAGLPVARTCVMHLNTGYVYQGGAYNLNELFSLVDVTAEVRDYLPAIPDSLREMKTMLAGECPECMIGKHCSVPYSCGFIGHCHSFLPDFPVTEIPRIKAEVLDELLVAGIYGILDVPQDYQGLSPAQRTVCRIIQHGEPRFGAGLAEALASLRHPIHFLDFETYMPALPPFPGTRPYQTLPMQWSCHTLRADGTLEHADFLHQDRSDPRLPFVTSLLAALDGDGPIVVYSSYENTRLSALAEELPELAVPIESIQSRLVDLEKVIRAHVQHPDFHGHTSLKFVLPALVDDLSYSGLAIQNGAVATLRYEAAIVADLPEQERQQIFADLRAYCAVDTLGLLRVVEALHTLLSKAGEGTRTPTG